MSRHRILFLFAALIALASVLAACGGGDGGSGGGDPQAIVDEATLQGIESGNIDLSLDVEIKGEKSGNVDVSLSGPFQGESGEEVSELDLTATAKGSVGGEAVDFDGGFTLLGNRAFVAYEGTEYEVDSTTFNFVKSMLRERGGQQSGEDGACQDAVGELELGDFMDNLSEGGSADVGGTSTTKVSGDLDAPAAIEAFSELAEDSACKAQLDATGQLPSATELDEAKSTVQDSVQSAHVELYVGDDDIVRRIAAQVTIEPAEGSDSGAERVELDLDLTLTGVNEEQTISAPKATKPLSELFLKLGINPIELLGAFQGGGGAPGLDSLLEGLGGGSSDDGEGGGGRAAYLDCLSEANTPVDLQKCAELLQ